MTCIPLNGVNKYHVLAAAIKTNANLIVTNNIKDFPERYLQSFSLSAKTADEFDVLNLLRNAGLKDTADYLHALL